MAPPITKYCAREDLGRLGVSQKALGRFATDELDQAIVSASRRIDSYLRARFILPLLQVGDDVKECCAILAVYTLLAVRGFSGDGSADEILQTRYDEQIAWLKLISIGRAVPDVTDSSSGGAEGVSTARPKCVSNSQQGWSTRGTGNGRGPFTQ